jgi:hypothetical protein
VLARGFHFLGDRGRSFILEPTTPYPVVAPGRSVANRLPASLLITPPPQDPGKAENPDLVHPDLVHPDLVHLKLVHPKPL